MKQACIVGDVEVLNYLLKNTNSDVFNDASNFDYSRQQYVFSNKKLDLIKITIDYNKVGAYKILLKSFDDEDLKKTALNYAKETNNEEFIKLLENAEQVICKA